MSLSADTISLSTVAFEIDVYKNSWLRNNGPDTVYLGGSNVTADTTTTGGFQLAAGERFQLIDAESVFAVIAAGKSATLTVIG